MKILINHEDKTKAFLIAESDSDIEVLRFFFPISFGFYELWERDYNKTYKGMYKKLIQTFPDVKGLGKLTSPEGFVPQTNKIKRQ